jgi:hypothetical protein
MKRKHLKNIVFGPCTLEANMGHPSRTMDLGYKRMSAALPWRDQKLPFRSRRARRDDNQVFYFVGGEGFFFWAVRPQAFLGAGRKCGGEGSCGLTSQGNQRGGRLSLSEFNFQPGVLGEDDFVSPSDPGVEYHLTNLIVSKPGNQTTTP